MIEHILRRLFVELGIKPSDDTPTPVARLLAVVIGLVFVGALLIWVTN